MAIRKIGKDRGHAATAKRGLLLFSIAILASCNNSKLSQNVPEHINNETKFSSKEFGVDGSPRVTTRKSVKKGGGTYKIGKPYTIRGKTYYPQEDPDYSKTGYASWYGPNFHGRLTANGEIYDQFSLSAAHPTMPLPSYARVTNLENGSSVTVRVNDRGPYAHDRIIDLSARAAELLGYTNQGVVKVRVDYVGKARMDGLDESFLVASYDPGTLGPVVEPKYNRTQIIVADVINGRKPLASVGPDNNVVAAYSGTKVPLPEFRPVTNNGIPLAIADTPTVVRPRPVSGLSGYVEEVAHYSRIERAFAQFDLSPEFRSGTQDIPAPVHGMKDLIQVRFGPFETAQEMESAENVLVRFGPVQPYSHNGNQENALLLVAAREQLSSFMHSPQVAVLPVLK